MRNTFFILTVLSAFVLPWWITGLCIVATTLRYRAWEVLIVASALDALYLPENFFHTLPIATLLTLMLLWIFEPVRARFL